MGANRLLWIAVAANVSLSAQQDVKVAVDDGPLLCFTASEEVGGRHDRVFYRASVNGTGPAVPFWRSSGNARVLRRLDRDHVLVASYGTPYGLLVIDLNSGASRELALGAPHGFVALHGDAVLHLGDARGDAADNHLYATPWRDKVEHRRLADARFASVPAVSGNIAVAITPDDREVWIVSLVRGVGRRVWQAPEGARSLRVALAPSGQRLAIGHVGHDGLGCLTVLDTGTGEVLRTFVDLPIQVSPFSSSTPTLEVGWHDDTQVVCSETRGDGRGFTGNFVYVTRDILSGDVADESNYAGIGISHRAPPIPGAATGPTGPTAAFAVVSYGEQTVLRRTGSPLPLASMARNKVQYEDFAVSPDGQFATARVHDHHGLILFSAAPGKPRELSQQSAHDLVWLSGTEPGQKATDSPRRDDR